MTEKIRVLVIDDSAYNRQIIAEILSSHDDIEVVGKASDGEEGLKAAAALRPDLITLDLEMPRMDGFTFLRILMSRLPTPVIVISSHSKEQSVFQALELGALDFIAKPTRHISPELTAIKDELIAKVLLFRHLHTDALHVRPRIPLPSSAPVQPSPNAVVKSEAKLPQPIDSELRVVAIGASTGGPPAIQRLLTQVPQETPTTIIVCQHMPAKFTKAFAERLDNTARLKVKEAADGDPLLAGRVYISPGGVNLLIVRKDNKRVISLQVMQPDDRYVPSIDKMFASAAEQFGSRCLGIVLTGMGIDGKIGAQKIRERGGHMVAESQESAVIYGMPKEVIEAGYADTVLPLPKIAEVLVDYCTGKRLFGNT